MSPTFTQDWCSPLRGNFSAMPELARYKGKPCRVLEIGVYEGMSAIWLVENVLTHKDSFYVGVDPFCSDVLPKMNEVHERAVKNLESYSGKVKLYIWHSQLAFQQGLIGHDFFDITIVDGDHKALPCLTDIVNCWHALKAGSVLVIDDYNKGLNPPEHNHGGITLAVDAFLNCLPVKHYKQVSMGYQCILEKLR